MATFTKSVLFVVLAACGGGTATAPVTNKARPTEPAPVVAPQGETARWIKELDDPASRERALLELEQLGDPAAIEAIGKVFLEDREVRTLQVLIAIARPLTPAEAKAKFFTAYETTGRPASWQRAWKFLERAITEVDAASVRSVDAATKAADALGESQRPEAIEPLLAIAQRPSNKKIFQAQIAAIRALGKVAGAGTGLAKLVDVPAPRHPRTARSVEEGRELEVAYGMHLAKTGAAINTIGELRITTANQPLVLALYRTPELATQIRRALVAAGRGVSDILIEVLAGKHAAVEKLFAATKLNRYCGEHDELPDAQCQPVSLRDFYAAMVLGDLRDPRATAALLGALLRPAVPAYYFDDQPGPTQHTAIFDSLRKLGAPEAAKPLFAIWNDKKLEVSTRATAMEAYGFVVRGTTGSAELARIASDNSADDALRVSAAATLARISVDQADIAIFLQLGAKYLDAADKKRKEAAGSKAAADAADKAFERAKQDLDRVKQALLATTKDPGASADRIRAETQRAKQAEDAFKAAKKKHRDATAPYRQSEQAAKAYVGYARLFQVHAARIAVALRCAGKLECYAGTLALDVAAAVQHADAYIKDLASWSRDEKLALLEAEVERSMIDLGKAGPAAAAHAGALLDAATSDNRIIRQSVLLALPKIAKLPCAACVAKLDAAIKAGEGKVTLGELNLETQVLRNYFQSN